MQKQIRLTREGYNEFQKEYEDLLKSRPEALNHLVKAREMGDLKENGYYKASRAKLSFIDNRLFFLKHLLKKAVITDPSQEDNVQLGSTVTVKTGNTEKSFIIVSEFEANPSESKLSCVSPIGRALMGKKRGESFNVRVPSGNVLYIVIDIRQ